MRHCLTVKSPAKVPYYAVIFSSLRRAHAPGYDQMAERMVELVQKQPGFLGFESASELSGEGITVSYWSSLEAVTAWREEAEHRRA